LTENSFSVSKAYLFPCIGQIRFFFKICPPARAEQAQDAERREGGKDDDGKLAGRKTNL
jgi:hypothetical protein